MPGQVSTGSGIYCPGQNPPFFLLIYCYQSSPNPTLPFLCENLFADEYLRVWKSEAFTAWSGKRERNHGDWAPRFAMPYGGDRPGFLFVCVGILARGYTGGWTFAKKYRAGMGREQELRARTHPCGRARRVWGFVGHDCILFHHRSNMSDSCKTVCPTILIRFPFGRE